MPRLRTVLNNIKNNEGPARLWTVIGGIVGLLGLVVSVTAAVVQFGSGSMPEVSLPSCHQRALRRLPRRTQVWGRLQWSAREI